MKDKKSRIDNFLKFFSSLILQNPGIQLNTTIIYNELTKLGLDKEERNKKINIYFNNWINYFEFNDNCSVFVSDKHPYFCQFVSGDDIAWDSEEHLKVYVPLDEQHINRGVIEIFEFLSISNISHVSKVGSDVRFDDIVVRLVDPDDMIKFVDFLNGNDYIQEGLIKPNPFAFCERGIPMVVDGSESFNFVVANLIFIYIDDKSKKRSLNKVGCDDFYYFIERYYNEVFSSNIGLNKLKKDLDINSIDEIVNHQNIFKLIIKVSDDNFGLDDYINHFRDCCNYRSQFQKKLNIYEMINSEVDVLDDEIVEETNELLFYIIDVMLSKYNDMDIDEVLCNVNFYIEIGNSIYLTRKNNLRQLIFNSDFRINMIKILKYYNCDLNSYFNLLVQKDNSKFSRLK